MFLIVDFPLSPQTGRLRGQTSFHDTGRKQGLRSALKATRRVSLLRVNACSCPSTLRERRWIAMFRTESSLGDQDDGHLNCYHSYECSPAPDISIRSRAISSASPNIATRRTSSSSAHSSAMPLRCIQSIFGRRSPELARLSTFQDEAQINGSHIPLDLPDGVQLSPRLQAQAPENYQFVA